MTRSWLWLTLLLAACSGSSGAVDAAVDRTLTPEVASEASAARETALEPPAAPSIDGDFEDWTAVPELASDPAGDAKGGLDLRSLRATSRGTTLFLAFELAQTVNASSGPASEGTLVVELTLPASRVSVDLRGRVATTDGAPAKRLPWSQLGYVSAPTWASSRFELRLDLARFGAKVGDVVKVDFSGSDQLAAPAAFTLALPAAPAPTPRSPDRQAGTTARIASLNTWVDGLTDAARQEAAGRLVKAAAADVYCFSELTATAEELATRLRAIDPLGDGAAWTVARHADLAIASRAPGKQLPVQSATQAFLGVALELAGKRLVVFTLRPTCCGYTGSAEDAARVQELTALAATIKQLRDGALGAELDPWRAAPVVVVGDWNLVGSRAPLDVLLDPKGPALSHWLLRHLVGEDVFTWRNDADKGGFPPGKLDVLVHSPELERRGGFVLESAELDATTANRLGLKGTDSQASDHLMLVADFVVK